MTAGGCTQELLEALKEQAISEPMNPAPFQQLGRCFESLHCPSMAFYCYLHAFQLGNEELAEKLYVLESIRHAPEHVRLQEQPPESTALVSVIMPTFNRGERIRASIESVLAQSIRDIELIVVDDCGTDDILPVLSSFGTSAIRYHRLAANSGPSAARNAGIELARGKFVAYLDDDDVMYPDHLAILLKHLQDNKCDFAYSSSCRAYGHFENGEFKVTRRSLARPAQKKFSAAALFDDNFISTLNVLHKRDCVSSVGGFNRELRHMEDWDLWTRIAARYPLCRIDAITGEYRIVEDSARSVNVSVRQNRDMHFYESILRSAYASIFGYADLYLHYKRRNDEARMHWYFEKLDGMVGRNHPISDGLSRRVIQVYLDAVRNGFASRSQFHAIQRSLKRYLLCSLRTLSTHIARKFDVHLGWRFKRRDY